MSIVQIGNEGLHKKYPMCFNNNPLLGEQSMDQIQDRKSYNLANQLFNIYSTKGREAALVWSDISMTDKERADTKPYVRMVFEKNGYTFGG
jgi:N-acyl-D-aspartate/D-glutamate deacylase